MKHNDPQDIDLNFDELELVAEKAGELNDRVGRIENEIGTQTKTLASAAMVLDAAIKGLGALRHETLESDIGTLQLSINEKTEHLAREISRFEAAVAEIDRRSEAGDEQLGAALRDIALGLRSSFDAKSAEVAEWSARVEREIAAHSVALAAIPPVLKGADAKQLNPRGEWEAGMIVNALDVVSYNGSSYISNVDGNTDKPSRSDRYTVLAKRSGNGAGGATDFGSLTGTIAPSQLVPGSTTYAVGDVLYAGTTGALSKLGAGSSGQLLSTQGAGAAPIWVTATGGAGDMNGPASATDNAIVRFDGTGGKTVQNSAVTIADTTGDIAGATSLTAPAATNLTLAGGSSGASLVLGQGTSAAATLAMPGVGIFTVSNVNDAGFVNVARFLSPSLTSGNSALILVGRAAASNQSAFLNYGYNTTAASTYLDIGHNGTTGQVRLTQPGNLLIGTTTDISGAGGLHVAGTGAASTTTSGALRVGSNVGLSGNAGGASYFGGSVVSNNASNPIFSAAISGTSIGSFSAFGADVYIGVDQNANGNMIFRRNSATEAMRITGSNGAVNITSTVSASSSTTGALQVAGGVGVSGAGYFGGDILAGQATATNGIRISASAISNESSVFFRDVGTTTSALAALSGNQSYTILNAPTGGTLYIRRGNDSSAGLTLNGTSAAFGSGAIVTVANTTASTNTTSGALVVTGGVGVGGAINVGGAATFAGAVTAGGLISTSGTFASARAFSATTPSGNGVGIRLLQTSVSDWEMTNTATTGALTFANSTTPYFTLSSTGAATFAGAVSLSTAGTTISIKSGTNAAAGTVTLSGGAATITSTAIDVNTVIVMSVKTMSGTVGDHLPSVSVAANSATIDGSSSDNSTYNWVALKVN